MSDYAPLDAAAAAAARDRQHELTKPRGSLGRLETLAVELAAIQGAAIPRARPAAAIIFAADHPVVIHGVSAYPSEVTRAMVANFLTGGAAASVLARRLSIPLSVVDVGVAGGPIEAPEGADFVRDPVAELSAGDLVECDAMPAATYRAALAAGRAAIDRTADVRVVVLGEMGIGNTTPASAVGAMLLGHAAAAMTGPGTGLDPGGVARKAAVIDRALARARAAGVDPGDPHAVCAALGGRDLAALVGAMERALERRIAVLVDGFIVTAAALVLCRARPDSRARLFFAHRSREPGHGALLAALDARPLLELEMALGEGSGALMAFPVLELACALHADMATFSSAGVPDRDP
ncbi:MAG TPA: nicotinate-nucleotide--dimethylbenzimidazole phosphoribosyltransferase [Kofleriaceae bacterium]|nr:nicotinate-nucleotide--dimethylbenzimidazole phosphoribosyltransferase [Kofleriaceae bacterium]